MEPADIFVKLMDKLEAKHADKLAKVISAGYTSMAASFRTYHLGSDPDGNFLPSLNKALRDLWEESITGGAAAFHTAYDPMLEVETKAEDNITGLIETFVGNYRSNVALQILQTSQRQVRMMMAGGLSGGQSADEVYKDMLEKIPEMAGIRALLISRTEVHAATQFASWQLARRSAIPLVKIWHSTKDEKTRDFGEAGKISEFNHRAMDNSRVGVNDYFLVPQHAGGFEQLMFPGDPNGSAGNIINCRCIQLYERA